MLSFQNYRFAFIDDDIRYIYLWFLPDPIECLFCYIKRKNITSVSHNFFLKNKKIEIIYFFM